MKRDTVIILALSAALLGVVALAAYAQATTYVPNGYPYGDAGGLTNLDASKLIGAMPTTAMPFVFSNSFIPYQTNWIDGKVYTNASSRPMLVSAPCLMTPGTLSLGNSAYSLEVPGVTTNKASTANLTILLVPAQNAWVSAIIPAGNAFSFTNRSATGTATIANGGQYMLY